MNNQNSNSVVPNNTKSPDSLGHIIGKIATQLEEFFEEYDDYFEVGGWNDTITIKGDDEEYEIMVRQCSCGEIELVYYWIGGGESWGTGRQIQLNSSKSVEEFLKDNFDE